MKTIDEIYEGFNTKVYMETNDDDQGILLCCDICKDQGRDRVVKQLGWAVTLNHARKTQVAHIKEHPITSAENEPRDEDDELDQLPLDERIRNGL